MWFVRCRQVKSVEDDRDLARQRSKDLKETVDTANRDR